MPETPEDLEFLLSHLNQIAQPKRGDLLQGTVIAADSSGLVVDLGLKRDGIVPRADLDKLPPEEADFQVNDEIAVLVVDPLDSDGNLVVSIAQARESEDWIRARKLMEEQTIIEAIPNGYNRGGLVVPFGRLRAFVPASHLSDLPRGLDDQQRAAHLNAMVGRKMPFRVIEVDPKRRRLVFSERKAIRQWRQDQKARVIETLKEGEIRKGVVTSLREFGAFVDIGGADGLIHISELSWERVEDPADVLQVGQEVETLVIRLDRRANRIGLSLKRLQTNPWEKAADDLAPGAEFEGVVSRHTNAGAFVRLPVGLEGLVRPANEGASLPAPGEEVRVRITSFDPAHERLDLDLVREGEPQMDRARAGDLYDEGR